MRSSALIISLILFFCMKAYPGRHFQVSGTVLSYNDQQVSLLLDGGRRVRIPLKSLDEAAKDEIHKKLNKRVRWDLPLGTPINEFKSP